MPNKDGTGPLSQGPIAGRGRGIGRGMGRGLRATGRGQGGTRECVCPKCGYKEPHVRGIPCSENKCPKCKTPMRGAFCS